MEAHVISFFQKIQVSTLCWKAYLTVFGDSQGPILEHCMEKGVTVTSATYNNILRNELRQAIHSKRRGRLTQDVLLLHDCKRLYGTPHNQRHSATELRNSRAPCLQPRLGPSDFHLVGPLKKSVTGRRLAADDEVKEAVHDWLHNQPQNFFTNGIKKLTVR
jgi:hypothetical protein